MANQTPLSPAPLPPTEPPVRPRWPGSGPPWYVGAVGALLVVIVALLVILVLRDDGTTDVQTIAPTTTDGSPTLPTTAETTVPSTTPSTATTATTVPTSASTTATTVSTTASTVSTTTTTGSTTTVDPAVERSAVWPWASSDLRFDDPVAAARAFAEDYVGFDEPVVGVFQQGDGRSGEVEVRPRAGGPATVVLVRQLGATDDWWIIGAATGQILVERPDALEVVTSPLELAGRSVAFEATVDVELRADGSTTPVATGIVNGGALELAPFSGSLPFPDPGAEAGAVVFYTVSAENGEIWEAAVVRIRFGQ